VYCCWLGLANKVVPVSRTKLAISKKSGSVREYLDQLKEAGELSKIKESALLSTPALSASAETADVLENMAATPTSISNSDVHSLAQEENNRTFKRWLFTDWLQHDIRSGKPGRQRNQHYQSLRKQSGIAETIPFWLPQL
jgi:hypothetical protein